MWGQFSLSVRLRIMKGRHFEPLQLLEQSHRFKYINCRNCSSLTYKYSIYFQLFKNCLDRHYVLIYFMQLLQTRQDNLFQFSSAKIVLFSLLKIRISFLVRRFLLYSSFHFFFLFYVFSSTQTSTRRHFSFECGRGFQSRK